MIGEFLAIFLCNYYHDLMAVFHFLIIRDYGVIVIHFQVSDDLHADYKHS